MHVTGGGSTFPQADIFVKPKKGDAIFFSYKGTDGLMDNGFTAHGECLPQQGEKWTANIWMREGVSTIEPYNMYAPSGHLIESNIIREQIVDPAF